MARERIPYFRFYPSDFMRGIRGLSAQETGLYTMLLCRMYEESGPINDHDLRLATYCGMRISVYQKTLEKLIALGKIERKGGCLFNERASSEIQSRADDLISAIKAGKASAQKRQQNQQDNPTPVQRPFNHTDTDTDKREAKASPKNNRGKRLSADWVLPREWGDWAVSEGLSEAQTRDQADRFRDYWVSKAGAGGVKLDWLATWRNWIRNSSPQLKAINGGQNDKPATKSQRRMDAFLRGAQLSS